MKPNCKMSFETINIRPKTAHVQTMAAMVKIHNEFISRGFVTRTQFINVVRSVTGAFQDDAGEKLLIRWWNFRVADPALNDQMDGVIEQLKSE